MKAVEKQPRKSIVLATAISHAISGALVPEAYFKGRICSTAGAGRNMKESENEEIQGLHAHAVRSTGR